MKLFTFYISKPKWAKRGMRITSWYKKTLTIKAIDLVEAYAQVEKDWVKDSWAINMFWPKSKIIDGKYVHLSA